MQNIYLKWCLYLLVGLLVLALSALLRTLLLTGDLRNIRSDSVMSCLRVDPIDGAEDMVADRENGIIYLSSCNRRLPDGMIDEGHRNPLHCMNQDGSAGRGKILRLDPNGPFTPSGDLTGGIPSDFHPHGLDLHITPDGEEFLFVVNHAKAGERIEIFKVEANGDLSHIETASDPLIVNPNDVAALGSRSFYVTNDGRHPWGSREQLIEHFSRQDHGNIILWDAGRARIIDQGYSFSNGINLSRDGNSVYILESTDRRLSVAARKPETSELSFSSENSAVIFNTAPDNVDVDEEGLLWIAGHSKGLQFRRHQLDPDQSAPSQIFVVDVISVKKGKVKGGIVHASQGQDISGASIALRYGDRVFIGAPYENHILACQLNPIWKPWERVRVER